MEGQPQDVDLVFEGGGVKGVGLAGALAVLEERGYRPRNVAGSSAGAITAALLAAGYTADELREIVFALDLRRFRDKAWEDKVPFVDRPLSVLLDLGVYEGTAFLEWLRALLAARGVSTFADLRGPGLQVLASDVTRRELLVLPRDADKLGVDAGTLEVATAVRMSMSIPIFFEPVRLRNPRTGREHLIVDGGMLSNFPVWLFDCEGAPSRPTFGLLLVEPRPRVSIAARLPMDPMPEHGPRALVAYLQALAQTVMEAHDRLYVESADFARTIAIPTLGIGSTEFDLSYERKLALYDSGRRAAGSFLETWSFEAYVAEFRSGKRRSRRLGLVRQQREAVEREAAER